ncbi:uncharacterized protein LOC134852893 [Symsagittifera roscoffensis]|uniref:uncharacterized protein LOC134852893 n=1 Tax=Symsagittifera roscoffensis TaxID=84072 RepID=UPI00307C0EF3
MVGSAAANSTLAEDDPFISFPMALQTGKTVFFSAYILLGVFLNLLLFIAICRESRLHKPSYFFLLNLSFVELIRVALCLPFYLIVSNNSDKFADHFHLCKSVSFFYTLLAYETILTLLTISLSRYSIIVHKEFYTKKLTKFVCLTVTAMTWTLAVIMAIPPIFRAGMPLEDNAAAKTIFVQIPYLERSISHDETEVNRYDNQKLDSFAIASAPYQIDSNVLPIHHQMRPEDPKPPAQLGCCHYYQITDGIGFTIVFNIVLVGVHLIHLRVFMFMRQHRKMNPTRRAPAISDNWTFFGPVAAPFVPTYMSSHLQSVVVQGVSFPQTNPLPATAPSHRVPAPQHISSYPSNSHHNNVVASAGHVNRIMMQRSTAATPHAFSSGNQRWASNAMQGLPMAAPTRHFSGGQPSQRAVMGRNGGLSMPYRDPALQRETMDSYEVGEKFTKTTYFLTCCVTLLWCPYIVINFTSVVSSEPISDNGFILATFFTFCQSLITPLACLFMIPPVGVMASEWLKTIKCMCRRRKKTSGSCRNGMDGTNQTPLYENLSQMVCSAV